MWRFPVPGARKKELVQAQAGEQLRSGIVYIAPPTSHLFVTSNGICLSEAVFVDLARPSADLLLQSVAASFKKRAIVCAVW